MQYIYHSNIISNLNILLLRIYTFRFNNTKRMSIWQVLYTYIHIYEYEYCNFICSYTIFNNMRVYSFLI